MSISVSVFLKDDRLPTSIDWQAAIRKAGFAVEMETDFDPRADSGFRPATYRGLTAGFEYNLSQVAAGGLGSKQNQAAAAGYELCVELVTHSNMAEMVSAALAAGALAELTGGVLFDDESGEAHAGSAAISWARGVEAEAAPDLDAG